MKRGSSKVDTGHLLVAPTKRRQRPIFTGWKAKHQDPYQQDDIDFPFALDDLQISTGPLEGINNKIKVLQRKAYGFRDDEFFQLQILFLHNKEQRSIGA